MSLYDDTEDVETELLKALAWTPLVAPFQGTDRYDVRACLGEGGFGVVYEVEDRTTSRRLALKTLKPQRAGFVANIRRLKREFRSVADLVHPNLVALHELSSHGQRWFFTMDLVRGCDFTQYVRPQGVVAEQRLRGALAQLVSGVAALHHAGVLHRDLKPSNALVETDGHVVILDFGLAGDDIEPGLYAAGTPSFMSPEQIAGNAVTAAADWYSVGVMLHEALTGELPASGRDALAAARAPGDLRQLCTALLRPEPSERPSVAEIRKLLGEPNEPSDAMLGGMRFVGRKRELALLQQAYAAMREGGTRVVRVCGEPGVGKSALLSRFVAALAEDAVVLASKCHERETVPFKAFDGVVDALVAHLHAMSPGELSRVLPRDIGLATQLFPVLGELDVIRDMPRTSAPVDPSELRAQSFRALAELLAALASSLPVVIVIDDLQWGDLDSARLLQHVLAAPQLRVLIVLAYRSNDSTPGSTLHETLRLLDGVTAVGDQVSVSALAADEARELAGMWLGADTAAARKVAERSEGHPMFIAELALGFAHREALDDVPDLVGMLWRRVERLEPPARMLVEVMAVAGGPLREHVCCAAAGISDAVPLVRALRGEHLLRAADGELDVFHDRVRDAVCAFLDAPIRARRHLALAEVLERAANPDLEAIARHFDGAGQREPAGRYALRAGDAAMNALAFDRAAGLYEMAIDRGEDGADIYRRLGDAWLAAGASSAGGRAYLEAAWRSDGSRAIDLLSLAGRELCCAGDQSTGEGALLNALAAVGQRAPAKLMVSVMTGMYHLMRMRLAKFRVAASPTGRDALQLEVLHRAAYGFGYMGVARSVGLMMRCARHGLASGEPRFVGRGLVLAAFGMVSNHPERPPVIDELLDRASAIGREQGDPEIEALALRIRGESHFMYGDPAAAAKWTAEAVQWITERCRGMGFHRRFIMCFGARARLVLGGVEQGRAMGAAVLAEAIDREDPVVADVVRTGVLAFADVVGDRTDAADRQLAQTSEDFRCGNLVFRTESKSLLAMYRGDVAAARAVWPRYLPDIKREGVMYAPAFRVMVVRGYCVALLANGTRRDVAEAKRWLRSLRSLRFAAASATRASIEANLAMLSGDGEQASAHLEHAREQYATSGFRLDAATTAFAHARLLQQDSEPAAAELRACGVVSPARWAAAWYPRLGTG